MSLILKNYCANRIYKFVQSMHASIPFKFREHCEKENFSFFLPKMHDINTTLIINNVQPSGF